jgi:hypothetical protein
MQTNRESKELMSYLASDDKTDLLASLPVVASHIESAAIFGILRSASATTLAAAQISIKRKLTVIAFGSLGRFEFVPSTSDLDPLVVVDGTALDAAATTAVRASVLTPLAAINPWLVFDERERVVAGDWAAVSNVDVRYPVLTVDQLRTGKDKLTTQRQWQVLLEGRPLYNDSFFGEIYDALMPQIKKKQTQDDDDDVIPLNFQRLTSAGSSFFGGFDNPLFLYKSASKYWKTRFLRDFFIFATQLTFILGWYRQRNTNDRLPLRYARAATVIKLMRTVWFAQELERECRTNAALATTYTQKLHKILSDFQIKEDRIILFGTHYTTTPGRLLHGLIMSVLSRFSQCWEKVYDPHVRDVLEHLPKDLNFDSLFEQPLPDDDDAREVVTELKQLRSSYRRYMAATARALKLVFARGRVGTKQTTPDWLTTAFGVFEKLPLL